MFDRRSPLILGAAPLGLALAAICWLLFGAHASALTRLDDLNTRLGAAKPAGGLHVLVSGADPALPALATPLFALSTGPGAAADVAVRLDGLAITPSRRAALISIGGKPADWLEVGATRDGVTLMEVHATKVTLDTAVGFKDIDLWQGPTAAAGAPSAAPVPAPAQPPNGR